MLLPEMQRFVNNKGKHTADGEQHELMMHIEVFDSQADVILLHGSRIEQEIAGAQ
jgi:hypothetical protein